jgi:hypothetical protein
MGELVHHDHFEQRLRRRSKQTGNADLALCLELVALNASDIRMRAQCILDYMQAVVEDDLAQGRRVAKKAVLQRHRVLIQQGVSSAAWRVAIASAKAFAQSILRE